MTNDQNASNFELENGWAVDIWSLGMLAKFLVTGDCSDGST